MVHLNTSMWQCGHIWMYKPQKVKKMPESQHPKKLLLAMYNTENAISDQSNLETLICCLFSIFLENNFDANIESTKWNPYI